VIHFSGGELQTRLDIFGFQIREVFDYLALGGTPGKHFEHVFDPDTHTPDARASAALFRVKGDSVNVAHGFKVDHGLSFVEPEGWVLAWTAFNCSMLTSV